MHSLRDVIRDQDKSALRILLAIFFWFVAYNAIEAFFTLYAQNHLGLPGEDGARLLGQLSVIFVIFALPAGYIGARVGRRRTIILGILGLMAACMLAMFFLPVSQPAGRRSPNCPALGIVPVIGLILMLAGAFWALINVNSLPMVVDMTDNLRVWHVHRAVLPVLHPGGHRRAEHQRLDHPAHRQKLQPGDDRRADLHVRGPADDDWCKKRGSAEVK